MNYYKIFSPNNKTIGSGSSERSSLLIKACGYLLILPIMGILILSLRLRFASFLNLNISLNTVLGDLLHSFLRVTVTALVTWLVAIVAGAVLNSSKWLPGLTSPIINLIRHISPFAWFPFAIIWFGLGESPIIFVLAVTLFFPALVSSTEIFADIPREYLDEAKVCGANIFQLFRYVEIPLTAIPLLNTFRILWGLGWTMVIAAEMLGTAVGLGYRLLDFRYLLYYEEMIIYILIMGMVGVMIDYLLVKLIKTLRS